MIRPLQTLHMSKIISHLSFCDQVFGYNVHVSMCQNCFLKLSDFPHRAYTTFVNCLSVSGHLDCSPVGCRDSCCEHTCAHISSRPCFHLSKCVPSSGHAQPRGDAVSDCPRGHHPDSRSRCASHRPAVHAQLRVSRSGVRPTGRGGQPSRRAPHSCPPVFCKELCTSVCEGSSPALGRCWGCIVSRPGSVLSDLFLKRE